MEVKKSARVGGSSFGGDPPPKKRSVHFGVSKKPQSKETRRATQLPWPINEADGRFRGPLPKQLVFQHPPVSLHNWREAQLVGWLGPK